VYHVLHHFTAVGECGMRTTVRQPWSNHGPTVVFRVTRRISQSVKLSCQNHGIDDRHKTVLSSSLLLSDKVLQWFDL